MPLPSFTTKGPFVYFIAHADAFMANARIWIARFPNLRRIVLKTVCFVLALGRI